MLLMLNTQILFHTKQTTVSAVGNVNHISSCFLVDFSKERSTEFTLDIQAISYLVGEL